MADAPSHDELPKATSSYLRRYGIDSVWAHLALNLASALMLTLAFPKPGWAAMAFFAPVPIGVLAMRTTRLWTLAWTTLLVFTGWWSLRVGWLGAVSPGAPWGMGLLCGTYMMVMAVALARVQRRFRSALTLTLPVFWVAQEAARSAWPWGGFPWFSLGSSQAMWKPTDSTAVPIPSGLLVQSADLFGVLTVSFLVAMTAGLIVDLIARPMTKRLPTGKVRVRRTVVFAVAGWVVCFAGALVYGYMSLAAHDSPSTGPETRTATITVIQTNVPQSNKMEGTSAEHYRRRMADWDRLFDLTKLALAESPDADLVVWPETMVLRPINDEYVAILDTWLAVGAQAEADGVLAEDEELVAQVELATRERAFRTRIDAFAVQYDTPIIAGGRAQYVDEDERLMNSAFLVVPGAESYPRYSKQWLVPFGEYVPGPRWTRQWFHDNISPYDYDYTLKRGERPVVFEVELAPASRHDAGIGEGDEEAPRATDTPLRLATPICFEDAVGSACREMVYANDGTKRVDLLVNLTNDGWFAGTHQGYQHLQLASLRCIENRVPMARSVNTGVSGFIDSSGRVTQVVSVGGKSQEVDGHATAQVQLDTRKTLYGRVGEAGPVGVGLTATLLLLGTWVPRRLLSSRRHRIG
ncbi:apolipoprotein N-acyltransferase [Phycisphaeraceae bacterium D3-23]